MGKGRRKFSGQAAGGEAEGSNLQESAPTKLHDLKTSIEVVGRGEN